MSRWIAWGFVALGVLAPSRVEACPCRGTSGMSGALTSQDQRVGVSLTQTAAWVHGVWDAEGEYGPLSGAESNRRLEFSLAAALRPVRRWEFGAQLGYGIERLHAPGVDGERRGLGDATLRVRWDAIDQPMLFEPEPWPSLSVFSSLRAPTGTVDRVNSGSVQAGTTGAGSAAASQGLGAWEMGVGVDLERLLSASYKLSLGLEAGYRFADDSLGVERQLGPRLAANLSLRVIPSALFSFGGSLDVGWEGDVGYAGETKHGTGQRVFGASLFAVLAPRKTPLRWGLLVRHVPAFDGVSVNALGTTSLGVSLGGAG